MSLPENPTAYRKSRQALRKVQVKEDVSALYANTIGPAVLKILDDFEGRIYEINVEDALGQLTNEVRRMYIEALLSVLNDKLPPAYMIEKMKIDLYCFTHSFCVCNTNSIRISW